MKVRPARAASGWWGVGRRVAAMCVAVLLAAAVPPVASRAQTDEPGAWLEQSAPSNWNQPGAAVPMAPAPEGDVDPRCSAQERPAASPEDDQVVAAGWRLFNAARVGWGLWVVDGLVEYDGMCRPIQFQTFVFADGQLAGTLSPAPMDSRTDGVGRVLYVSAPGAVTAAFVRYLPTDPLCCPSSNFTVEYTVDRSGGAPLLVPLSSTRSTT